MKIETARTLMLASIDHATAPANYRSRRSTRRDRQALVRMLVIAACALGYFGVRMALA